MNFHAINSKQQFEFSHKLFFMTLNFRAKDASYDLNLKINFQNLNLRAKNAYQ